MYLKNLVFTSSRRFHLNAGLEFICHSLNIDVVSDFFCFFWDKHLVYTSLDRSLMMLVGKFLEVIPLQRVGQRVCIFLRLLLCIVKVPSRTNVPVCMLPAVNAVFFH